MAKELFDLGDDLSLRLTDFCEASRGAPRARIVREALDEFITEQLAAEPQLRKRYDAARAKRLGLLGEKVRVLKGGSHDRS